MKLQLHCVEKIAQFVSHDNWDSGSLVWANYRVGPFGPEVESVVWSVAVICCCALAVAVAGPSITAALPVGCQWARARVSRLWSCHSCCKAIDKVQRHLRSAWLVDSAKALEATAVSCAMAIIGVCTWAPQASRVIRSTASSASAAGKGTPPQIKWLVSGNERPRTSLRSVLGRLYVKRLFIGITFLSCSIIRNAPFICFLSACTLFALLRSSIAQDDDSRKTHLWPW